MRAIFASAAAASHCVQAREVEYSRQPDRSLAAETRLRLAHRLALGMGGEILLQHDAARPEADDAAVLHHHGAIGLVAGAHGLVLHFEGGVDEGLVFGGGCGCTRAETATIAAVPSNIVRRVTSMRHSLFTSPRKNRAREKEDYAGAPDLTSLVTIESISAWNDASMMLDDTPTVVQRSPVSSSLSISTRVTASVPELRIRTR